MFKSKNDRALNTSTGVPLTPPTSATDYRAGCSVIIQCSVAIFLGGQDARTFEVAANTPFPINEMDPASSCT